MHFFGQRADLRPALFISGRDDGGQQVAQRVDGYVYFAAPEAFGPVVAGSVAALGRTLQRARIENHGARVGGLSFV